MNPIAERMYEKKTAGPDTQVRVGVAVVIRDKQGRVLLEKRSDCGMWGLPGGAIEPGESVREAALREVKEETGLEVEIIRLVGIYSDPQERIVTYPDKVCQLVDILLEARPLSGKLAPSRESEELRFFDPSSLPDTVPPTWAPLRDALNGATPQIR